MVQVLPEREQSTTSIYPQSLSGNGTAEETTYTNTHTRQHLSETDSASICEKIPAFGLDQGGKQSSYPGALCTKPRTTASIHRSGTHSTNRQHILCQMQSDLVRSVRQGTKTLRISSEVEEKIGKYTRWTELVQWYSRSASKFQDPFKMKKYNVQFAVLNCPCGKN